VSLEEAQMIVRTGQRRNGLLLIAIAPNLFMALADDTDGIVPMTLLSTPTEVAAARTAVNHQ
jgi:hypothetical protein